MDKITTQRIQNLEISLCTKIKSKQAKQNFLKMSQKSKNTLQCVLSLLCIKILI